MTWLNTDPRITLQNRKYAKIIVKRPNILECNKTELGEGEVDIDESWYIFITFTSENCMIRSNEDWKDNWYWMLDE